jgi:hypothetical protein
MLPDTSQTLLERGTNLLKNVKQPLNERGEPALS